MQYCTNLARPIIGHTFHEYPCIFITSRENSTYAIGLCGDITALESRPQRWIQRNTLIPWHRQSQRNHTKIFRYANQAPSTHLIQSMILQLNRSYMNFRLMMTIWLTSFYRPFAPYAICHSEPTESRSVRPPDAFLDFPANCSAPVVHFVQPFLRPR